MAIGGDSHAIESKIDPVLEKPWQRAKRFEKYDFYAKSAYPPMQIEPLADERSRIAGEGMTPEQRALRKQWVKDQILHHEPRYVPEVRPINIFRRIYRWPADNLIFKPLLKAFNYNVADNVRYAVPKVVMVFLASYIAWYQIKYHPNDWLREGGVRIYQSKPVLFGKEALETPDKDKTDYYDLGFKSRKALLSKD